MITRLVLVTTIILFSFSPALSETYEKRPETVEFTTERNAQSSSLRSESDGRFLDETTSVHSSDDKALGSDLPANQADVALPETKDLSPPTQRDRASETRECAPPLHAQNAEEKGNGAICEPRH